MFKSMSSKAVRSSKRRCGKREVNLACEGGEEVRVRGTPTKGIVTGGAALGQW